MTDTTEQNVNQAIDWLQKTGTAVQDFAVEQAPLYCREVVQWEMWSGLALTAGGVVLVILACRFLKEANRLRDEELKRDGGWTTVTDNGSRLLFWLFMIFSILAIFFGGSGVIKAAVAPRLVVVEHLRGLGK